jgi:hypothetical protein
METCVAFLESSKWGKSGLKGKHKAKWKPNAKW